MRVFLLEFSFTEEVYSRVFYSKEDVEEWINVALENDDYFFINVEEKKGIKAFFLIQENIEIIEDIKNGLIPF